MPAKRIIPSMLLSNGRLVKGRKFKAHEDAGNPVTTARIYNDQMADELSILDIDATPNNKNPDIDILRELSKRCFIPISFGGGINTVEIAAKVMESGADKIIINQAAFNNLEFIKELSDKFGKQAIVFAIDYTKMKNDEKVLTKTGQMVSDITPFDLALKAVEKGAGEILLTYVDHEGTRLGPDIETIHRISKKIDVPLIAHGGVGDLDDFVKILNETDASAVAAGRILQFADNNLIKVRRYIQSKGVSLATH